MSSRPQQPARIAGVTYVGEGSQRHGESPATPDAGTFAALRFATRTRLLRLSELVDEAVPDDVRSWMIRCANLKPSAGASRVVGSVAQWARRGPVFLYYFQVKGGADLVGIEHWFLEMRERKRDRRAYARVVCPSVYLYVGTTKVMARALERHLGYSGETSYSLQLAHWAPRFGLELELVCAKYRSGLPQEVYKALEDTLCSQLRPMFARKGDRRALGGA